MTGGQVNVTVADGGSANIVVPGSSVQLVLGVAAGGPLNQIVATRNPQTLSTTFVGGPLPEAAALSALAGGTILAMRVATNAAGVVRHPTTVAVTAASNVDPIVVTTGASHGLVSGDIVTIAGVTGNTAANGTFEVTVLSPTTFSIPIAGSGAYVSGGTVAWGGVVYSGTGTLTPTITLDGTVGAYDDYYVKILFPKGGTIGTAGINFQVSLDAGRSFGPVLALGTALTYTIPNTGITLVFPTTQTVVTGDSFAFSTIAPAWNTAGIQAALQVFLASQYALQGVGSVHIVGVAAGADVSTISGYFETLLAAGGVYARFLMSSRDASPPAAWGGTGESESTWMNALLSDFSAVSAKRNWTAAPYWNIPSAFTNAAAGAPRYRRCASWAFAARQVVIPPQRHGGRVSDGALSQIVVDPTNDPLDGFVYHDERINPGLDYIIAGAGGRFASTMTRGGYGGVFMSNPLSMAPQGSDFFLVPRGNVMDVTCYVVRQIGQLEIDADIRTNPNGTIYENDAAALESLIGNAVNSATFAQSMTSTKCKVTVDRTYNVYANNAVQYSVTIFGRAYVLSETAVIGFNNPNAAS